MDLDDQLAALAAGELDADEARALTARVGSDPALQRRLARIQRLDQVLAGWEAPALTAEATDRIDAAITDALDALPDAPLVTAADASPRRLRALPNARRDELAASASVPEPTAAADELAAARARRASAGIPRWVAGLGIAAAAFAVVGTAGQLLGSADDAGTETLAGEASADQDSAEESLPEAFDAQVGPLTLDGVEYTDATLELLAELAPSGLGFTSDDAASAGMADTAPTQGSVPATGPSDDGGGTSQGDGASAEQAPGDDALRLQVAGCLPDALATGLGTPVLLATGTYDGQPALFVVLEGTSEEQGATLTTFAYAPSDCALLATRTTTR